VTAARAVGAGAVTVVDRGLTRTGTVQLRRHWAVPGARAIVLIVHGIGEHSGRYSAVAATLNAAGLDVVAIDLPGFGGSGGRRAYIRSFDEFVDDVEDQLVEVRALGLPTVLLGHSMGGLVAREHVQQHRRPRPDLLVLSGPALAAGVPAPLRLVTPLAARLAPRVAVPSPIPVAQLASDAAVGETFRADPLNVRVTTPALGAAVLRAARWANDHLGVIDLPTLVVHGGDDRIVPTRSSEALGRLPGVERRVHAGLRHEPHNEREGSAVVAGIAEWIHAALGLTSPSSSQFGSKPSGRGAPGPI
jgi:acylglycerol lipase